MPHVIQSAVDMLERDQVKKLEEVNRRQQEARCSPRHRKKEHDQGVIGRSLVVLFRTRSVVSV